jgi:RNase H-like domain found in reverse transcriptase
MSIIEANLSNYTTKGILSQYNKNGVLYPIVYFLKQLNLAKYNYKIYNKELLAIIRCFK